MIVARTTVLDPKKEFSSQATSLNSDLEKVFLCLQGRVRFGSGADASEGENIKGQFQVIADTGSANTEFTVAHDLGAVPVGYLVTKISNAGVIYLGTTSWDASNIYLKSSAANSAVTIFIII